MIILRDLEIAFDDRVLSAVNGTGVARPASRRRLLEVLREATTLVKPAACYESYPIEAVLHSRLHLAGGARIGGGMLTSVVAGAEELVLAVCTIGPALDERVREHRAEGRHFEMLMLDALGTWAMHKLRGSFCQHRHAELSPRGWRVSAPLSPGDSGWPIREQRVIFNLLDPGQIGVALDAGYVMRPLHSLSLALGAGAGPMGTEGLLPCEVCSIRDRCRYATTREPARAGTRALGPHSLRQREHLSAPNSASSTIVQAKKRRGE
jgi:hypothetical protein